FRCDVGRDLARHGVDIPDRRSHLDAARGKARRHRYAAGSAGQPPLGVARVRRDVRSGGARGGRPDMRRSWASITVGALVLIVGVISYKLIRSTSERTTASEGYAVWAVFHDASGLIEKSRVMTAGISVGQIEKRELVPSTARAKITVRIAPNIILYENPVVAKKSASLLGEYYLEIDPGTEFKEVDGRAVRQNRLKD